MNPLPKLKNVRRILLQSGHGGLGAERFDPGAVNTRGDQENTEVDQIIALLAPMLQAKGMPVLVTPDSRMESSIRYVNLNGLATDWALEIHKDSFIRYDATTMHRRMGVYYLAGDAESAKVGETMRTAFIKHGANKYSWARPDTHSNHGGLGWIRQTKMPAHLLECGFMAGPTDGAEDKFYAEAICRAICDCLGIPF